MAALVIVVAAWWIAVALSGVSDYLAKTPPDVWDYLFIDGGFLEESAAVRRAELVPMIGVTLFHAGTGLALGVSLGLVGTVLLFVSRVLRAAFMPLVFFMQTVPLMAMAPVIYAVFGSGVLAAAAICAIVTFFPLLINLSAGLNSASPETLDLVHVYGGGRAKALLHVQLPASLPYIFAGLKIALPITVSAATIYEYMFTFEGIGAFLFTSKSYSNYGLLWTLVVIATALSLVAYALVVLAERIVLGGRFAPEPGLARR